MLVLERVRICNFCVISLGNTNKNGERKAETTIFSTAIFRS